MAEQTQGKEKTTPSAPKKPQGADPGEYFYNVNTLHIIVFVGSLFMFVGYFLIIYQDYDREWKQYQQRFNEIEMGRVTYIENKEEKNLEAPGMRSQIDQLDKELDAAQKELKNSSYDKFVKERAGLEGEHYNKQQLYNFAKSDYQAIRFNYEEAKHKYEMAKETEDKRKPEDENEFKKQEVVFKDVLDKIAKTKAEFDAIDNKTLQLDKDIDAEKSRVADIQGKLAKITKDKDDLVRRLGKEGHTVPNIVRNLPIMEMFSPSIKVQQVILPNLQDDFHFAKVYKVDRCMTCHVSIGNPAYEIDEKSGEFKDEYLKQYFADKAKTEDEKVKYTKVFKAHPRLDLYVASSSKHPLEKFGCTVCHNGDGRSTEFSWSVHTPDSVNEEKSWERKYNYHKRELWDFPMHPKKYVYSSCRKCHSSEVEIETADEYNKGMVIFERAGCYACHKTEGYTVYPGAEEDKHKLADADYKNFYRRPGPNLKFVKDKIAQDWMYKWIKDPRSFRATTKMPTFFGQTNSRDKDKDDEIAAAVVKYIFSLSESRNYPQISGEGDVKKGEELVQSIGCRACHVVGENKVYDPKGGESRFIAEFGPDLNGVGSKLNKSWLFNWLKDPKHYWKDTKMPNLRLSDHDALDIAQYLLTLKNDKFDKIGGIPSANAKVLDELVFEQLQKSLSDADAQAETNKKSAEEKQLYLGSRMVTTFGCYSCHEVKGFENTPGIGVELSGSQAIGSKPVNRFDFGNLSEEKGGNIPETRYDWIFNKLRNPRVYDTGKLDSIPPLDLLRMPNFYLTDSEAHALVTFLLSLTNVELSKENLKHISGGEVDINRGRRIIREENCKGCHRFALDKFVVGAMEAKENKKKQTVDLVAQDLQLEAKLKSEDADNYYVDWVVEPTTLRIPAAWDDKMQKFRALKWDDMARRYYVDFKPSTLEPVYLSDDELGGMLPSSISKAAVKKHIQPDGGDIFMHVLTYKAKKAGIDVAPLFDPGASAEDKQNVVSQLSKFEVKLPPLLRTEGAKAQSSWLFNFLKSPVEIRPNLSRNNDINLRMPTFGFDDEEAISLTRYFAAVDKEEYPYVYIGEKDDQYFMSRKEKVDEVDKYVDDLCIKCHIYRGNQPPGKEERDNWAPELDNVENRLKPRWLNTWFDNPTNVYPGTVMLKPDLKGSNDAEKQDFKKAIIDYLMNAHRYKEKEATESKPVTPHK